MKEHLGDHFLTFNLFVRLDFSYSFCLQKCGIDDDDDDNNNIDDDGDDEYNKQLIDVHQLHKTNFYSHFIMFPIDANDRKQH